MPDEAAILQDLFAKWISLGVEFADGAPGVSAIYVYVSSERGSVYPEILFEQDGQIRYPSDVVGVDAGVERVRSIHKLQFEDLRAAEAQFEAAGIPAPTEYRLTFDTGTRALDVQLSRKLIYANDPVKVPEQGVADWFGDRAPALF
jgi:hypothetical protein